MLQLQVKDMGRGKSLARRVCLRMLQNKGKVARICRDSCILRSLSKVMRHFNFRSFSWSIELKSNNNNNNNNNKNSMTRLELEAVLFPVRTNSTASIRAVHA